jgi:hypothetical protein
MIIKHQHRPFSFAFIQNNAGTSMQPTPEAKREVIIPPPEKLSLNKKVAAAKKEVAEKVQIKQNNDSNSFIVVFSANLQRVQKISQGPPICCAHPVYRRRLSCPGIYLFS